MDVKTPSAVLVVVKNVVREGEPVKVVNTKEVTVEGTWASTLRSDERNKTTIVDNRRTETNRELLSHFIIDQNSHYSLPKWLSTDAHSS